MFSAVEDRGREEDTGAERESCDHCCEENHRFKEREKRH